jgi:hypothetical protein
MTAIVLISNNNEYVTYICAVGIFGLFLMFIIGLGQLVRDYFKYNYFEQDIFIDKDNNRFRSNPKYYYYLIGNSKNYKAIKRYAGKQEWKELPKISETELQGYKKGYRKKGDWMW